MESKYNIRELGNSDSTQAIALILPIQQLEFGVAIEAKDQPDLADIETYYRRPGGNFWGAFEGETLVGTIGLLALGHRAGAIRKMFVREAYRGKEKAVGQQLLDHLLEECRAKDIADIYLGTVAQMSAAHRFYERNGFVRTDVAALPSYFPLMKVDNVFYHKNLNLPQ